MRAASAEDAVRRTKMTGRPGGAGVVQVRPARLCWREESRDDDEREEVAVPPDFSAEPPDTVSRDEAREGGGVGRAGCADGRGCRIACWLGGGEAGWILRLGLAG